MSAPASRTAVDWGRETVASLTADLAAGRCSSLELTEAALDRAEKANPKLNAFITLDPEGARQRALAADERRARGHATPLTGIPIAHKDLFCTRGLRTTCASRMLADFVPEYDATVVARLFDAGAVFIGKTNMDEFAMGSANENSYFGPAVNPWDAGRVAGGSSGGSAVAVAAGLVPAATASDTGGSIRLPAGFNGITGLKPTYGRISRFGMVAFASSLDQAGPLAWTAQDCALMLNALAGFDASDATSLLRPAEDFARHLDAPLEGLRLAFDPHLFDEVEGRVAPLLREALESCRRLLGADLVEVELASALRQAVPAYYIISSAEASSNLARYDGVRYGHRSCRANSIEDLYELSRAEGFGLEVERRILIGSHVLSSGYYDAYYDRACRVRRAVANRFDDLFATADLLFLPTAPSTAFARGSHEQDPVAMYLVDLYTTAANLAGLPAMAIPCGFASGLPVSMQLLAPAFSEARLLAAAHRYQRHSGWKPSPPPAAVA